VQFAWKLGVVALVALALVILPGSGSLLDVLLTILSITFFAAIAFMAYRLFRQYRFELETLPDSQRLALFGALGVALVTLTATNRLFDAGGLGALAWFALLGLASYAIYWVWTQYRSYG
jgi:uncharacterized protein involved in cysteine biosynthesis